MLHHGGPHITELLALESGSGSWKENMKSWNQEWMDNKDVLFAEYMKTMSLPSRLEEDDLACLMEDRKTQRKEEMKLYRDRYRQAREAVHSAVS